jgi:hypothetical protein
LSEPEAVSALLVKFVPIENMGRPIQFDICDRHAQVQQRRYFHHAIAMIGI